MIKREKEKKKIDYKGIGRGKESCRKGMKYLSSNNNDYYTSLLLFLAHFIYFLKSFG